MWVCQFCIMYSVMDQFRNDVALWVKKLRGRYDAKFIEPENVNKISWAVKMPNICIICHRTSRKFKDINFIPFPKKFEIREKWLKSLKMLNCVTGRVSTQGRGYWSTGWGVVLAIFYVFYPIFLRSSQETFVSPDTPLLFCINHNDLPTKWIFIKESAADRGSIITVLRFLAENGRNRSNFRQLSEILFFVKLKHQKERKTTF